MASKPPGPPTFLPSPVPPRRDLGVPGRRRMRRLLVATVCLLVVFGLALSAVLSGGLIRISVVEGPAPRPNRGVRRPSGVAGDKDPRSSEYSFLNSKHGEPARWDPCEPLEYVVNPQGAPPESMQTLRRAIKRVERPTHLRFHFEGFTTELPQAGRPLVERGRYGPGWAPILISWASPESSDEDLLEPGTRGTTLGVTHAAVVWPDEGPPGAVVSAIVELNNAPLPAGFGQPNARGLIMQHELGHVVGLDHVAAEGEIMNPRGGGALGWGPGDLTGLRLLGRSAGCFPPPAPPF